MLEMLRDSFHRYWIHNRTTGERFHIIGDPVAIDWNHRGAPIKWEYHAYDSDGIEHLFIMTEVFNDNGGSEFVISFS